MPISDLRAIETFTKAIELGSIRRAAAAQGVSPQAASQAIAGLEERLGVRLLHRTTRSLALTYEGQQFLEAAQPALAALERGLCGLKELLPFVGEGQAACRAMQQAYAQAFLKARDGLARGLWADTLGRRRTPNAAQFDGLGEGLDGAKVADGHGCLLQM